MKHLLTLHVLKHQVSWLSLKTLQTLEVDLSLMGIDLNPKLN